MPDFVRDTRPLSARRIAKAPGSPIEPVGNPLLAGVGPGSWAERAERPDMTAHGDARIVPLRVAEGFGIAEGRRIRAALRSSAVTGAMPARSPMSGSIAPNSSCATTR